MFSVNYYYYHRTPNSNDRIAIRVNTHRRLAPYPIHEHLRDELYDDDVKGKLACNRYYSHCSSTLFKAQLHTHKHTLKALSQYLIPTHASHTISYLYIPLFLCILCEIMLTKNINFYQPSQT